MSRFTCPRRREQGDLEENKDSYAKGRGLVHQVRGCTYCGSMSPEDFFFAVHSGLEIGPTDKSYKAYVGDTHGKMYFQHFSDADKEEFIRLLNNREMKVGYPGYFYVNPFFVAVGPR